MLPIGRTRYIDFALADVNSTPVPGRTLADWGAGQNRLIFMRDSEPCLDVLSLKDYGDGRYTLTYQPTSAGHDYLQIYDAATDIRVLDVEDIVPAGYAVGGGAVYALDQDFGGSGALLVTLPQPELAVVQVYLSSDWEAGLRSDAYAVGFSAVSAGGAWTSTVSVQAGTYHVVASKPGSQQIIKAYLGVG